MKDKYIFPAVLSYADDGITILFPDLPGCITCGDNEEEAIKNAHEVLGLHIWGMEEDKEDVPEATPVREITIQENTIITLIDVYMPPVRDRLNNKAVKVTLTIPQWLKTEADNEKVNFSQMLQEGLKIKLGKMGC